MQNVSCAKLFFYYHANKTHFHKKGFPLGLVLRERIFGTRKRSIVCGYVVIWSHKFKGVMVTVVSYKVPKENMENTPHNWVFESFFFYKMCKFVITNLFSLKYSST